MRLSPTDRTRVGILVLLGVVVFVFIHFWRLFSRQPPLDDHLGAEYYCIAQALVDGRGYSDPFCSQAGPTAWMPPVFPVLLAGLLLVLKTKVLVARAVVGLTFLALVAAGMIVFAIARDHRTRLSPVVAVGLYLGWLWAFYRWFFGMTHDIWLLTLVVSTIAFVFSRAVTIRRWNPWAWGLLGALTCLTSPSLTFAWVALSIYLLGHAALRKRQIALSFVVAAALAAPWAMRNAWVFHKAIPTKSNLFFEAYQANYLDDDGIYDGSFEYHPYTTPRVRKRYGTLGETAFLEPYKTHFFSALRQDPGRYVHDVIHRLFAVTAEYVPSKFTEDTPFKSMALHVVYPLPFVALLSFLWLRGKAHRFVMGLAIFAGAYLSPYVVVAFYLRYLMPLSPILVLFAFFGADQAAAACAERFGAAKRTLPTQSQGSAATS